MLKKNEYISSEIEKIIQIYKYLYPHNIRILIKHGIYPSWGNPITIRDYIRPHQLENNIISSIETRPNESQVSTTILVDIPSDDRNTSNDKQTEWKPKKASQKFAIKYAPVLFEKYKYLKEKRARRKTQIKYDWDALKFYNSNDATLSSPQVNKPKTIILALHWLETGGAEKFAFDCVRIALNAGFRVIVIADKQAPHSKQNLFENEPNVTFLRADRYLAYEDWPLFLERLITLENVVAVHLHHCGAAYNALAHIKATCPNVKILDTTHIIEHKDGGFVRISGVWTNFIDYHHVISNELKNFYKKQYQRTKNVLLGRLIENSPNEIAFNFNGKTKKIKLIFVGRLTHQKRPVLLINIVKKLIKKGYDIKLDIIGDGPYKKIVTELIEKYKLNDKICMHEPNSPVAKLLKSSDILILPSANEGLALVCYEAIENGVIPISTDVGAQSELLPPSCLTSADPTKCIAETVNKIITLASNAAHLENTKRALIEQYNRITNEPSGVEVINKIYLEMRGATH